MSNKKNGLKLASWKSNQHYAVLAHNLRLFLKKKIKKHPLQLEGQLLDAFFLNQSKLYKKSRELYLRQNGVFEPRLTTTPRSLSSMILLENRIQYSPTQDEILWTIQNKNLKPLQQYQSLQTLVSYSVSLFHEQNHRILWSLLLPPKKLSKSHIQRTLNLSESIVIALDMALGDELGPLQSSLGYLSGTLYDPGSTVKFKSKREKLNYYHLAMRSTYLLLEGYDKSELTKVLPKLAPELSTELSTHAVERALKLDDLFVINTNRMWQDRNYKIIRDFFTKKSKKSKNHMDIQPDPDHWVSPYLLFEKVLSVYFDKA